MSNALMMQRFPKVEPGEGEKLRKPRETRTKTISFLGFAPRPSEMFWAGEPWPLLAASRCVAESGHPVKIIQSVRGIDYMSDVRRYAPDYDMFGVSVMTGRPILEGIEASREFKKRNPKGIVVWGGWHPSIDPIQTLECESVDAVVVGQGEEALLEMVESEDWSDIRGIAFKKNGKILVNPPRVFQDINEFPAMDYNLIDMERNIKPSEVGKRSLRYVSSQGCPHRCGFCVEPSVYAKRWVGLSPERVVSEIKAIRDRWGIDSVIFTDSNFFTSHKRSLEIAKGFIREGLNIKWGNANGRTHQLLKYKDADWDVLVESGLKSILVGAESGLQSALDIIQKDCTVEDTINLGDICNRHGVRITFSMMVGLPYPGKTREELTKLAYEEFDGVVNMTSKIYKKHGVQNIGLVFVYTPYSGTPLYLESLKHGFQGPKNLAEWANFELNHRTTPWVPMKLALKVELLHEFVFRWIDGNCMDVVRANRSRLRWFYLFFAHCILLLAKLRWKFKFFGLPLDHLLLKKVLEHVEY